jgi:hypothetical protein
MTLAAAVTSSVALSASLLLCVTNAMAADVTSTRDTAYDFQTQTAAGVGISNHARFDTAFVACLNNPSCAYVQGGRYRVNRAPVVPPPVVTPPVVPATGTASLSWEPPTQWTDGTPITVPLTYRVEYGIGNFATRVPVNALTYKVTGLGSGLWQFRVYALSGAIVSDSSNIVTKAIP